ncbi:MAG: V-type ATPase subunit [Brevinematales bacterium]|nr:V-type ATPase subunit [Brevinematales bacterium]
MSYSTTMALLMYHIRREFYKTIDTSIIDTLSSFSRENILETFHMFEKQKLDYEDIKKYIINLPTEFSKKILKITRDPDIKELIEAYLLYYEFYNLNTMLRAKLSGHNESDLFLFNYSSTSSVEEIRKLEKIEDIKNLYIKIMIHHKLKNKNLYNTVKTLTLSSVSDLLLYSSIEYYQNLLSKKVKFGHNFTSLVITKAFYEIALMLAKMKFLSGIDVEGYIHSLTFLEDRQNILVELFVSDRDSFIKKCIDLKVIPPNFIVTDIDDIDKMKNIILKNKAKNIIIGNPLDPSTIVAMIILREIDMKNYFSIIGGFESGFSFEKVRQMLIL